ncbi:DUF4293 family protein [Segetibacter sp. 3557_3]|uniref:DUF4293 domain-containing protein n=1 Tax=Segetibacter sp. 3557_3 TaxID=2547429 RepID=UPI001058CA7D|nr:DUF4293 domain-containing protein [Segetibacter sp. 3557_3]TDH23022.1 DUF4293 family protein [Segetibacter sp. 3557_3]
MIQRIQSIWLFLAAVCAFLTIRFSFFSGNKMVNGQKVFTELSAESSPLHLLILSVAVGLGALIAVFLYKDRKLQLRITVLTLLLSIVNIVLYFLETKKFAEGNFDLTAVFSLVVPLFLFLAMRGINRDQKLVRSLDRLR